MERFFRGLAVAFILSICGTAFRAMGPADDDEFLPDNAPDGAVEYFESTDGKSTITLFEDRFVAHGEAIGPEDISIPIRDISRVTKMGTNFKIASRDGSFVEFSLDFFSNSSAKRFKETIDDLIKDSKKYS